MKVKFIAIIALAILVSGCAGGTRNLRKDLKGTDKIMPSPCAGCEHIEYYNPTAFEWVEVNHG